MVRLIHTLLINTGLVTVLLLNLACIDNKTNLEQPLPARPATPAIKITQDYRAPVKLPQAAPTQSGVAPEIITPTTQVSVRTHSVKTHRVVKPVKTPSNNEVNLQFPISVIDRNGDAVRFDAPPERIVAFDSAAVETLFVIGEGHRVVGTHEYITHPPEAENIAKVGDAFNMDIEAIVDLNPDLVFIFYSSFEQQLEDAGLKVLMMENVDDDYIKMSDNFRMWGAITGAVQRAEILSTDFERRISLIEETLAPYKIGPSVFQDVGGMWTPGNNTLVGKVFQSLKLQNIAHDVDGYIQFSPEIVIERNPQYIIAPYWEDNFTHNPAYAEVLAVKNGTVLTPNWDYLDVAGPRFILGMEELAKAIYPGIFK